MGAGLAFGGQAVGQALQGYNQGKEQARQVKFQQADELGRQADRVAKTIADLPGGEMHPSFDMLNKQYSDLMDQHDKLIGEKGMGAWKAVKSLIGLGSAGSGGQQQSSSPLASATAQTPTPLGQLATRLPDQEAQSPDTQGTDLPTRLPSQGSTAMPASTPAPVAPPSPSASPTAPLRSGYRIQAYSPDRDPNVPKSSAAQMVTINQATGLMRDALINPQTGQAFKNMNELRSNPQSYQKVMDAFAASAKGEAQGLNGLSGALMGQFNAMITPHESLIHVNGDHPYGKFLGLKPGDPGYDVSPQVMSEIVSRNTPLVQMQNKHATLGSQIAELEAAGKPVPKDMEAEFQSLDSIIRPERTLPSMFLQSIDRADPQGPMKAAKAYMEFQEQLRQKYGIESEHYQPMVDGQGFLVAAPTKAGGKVIRMKDEKGNPVFMGEKGRQGAEWVIAKGPNQEDIARPNTHVIARNLENGSKTIEEAQDELDRMERVVPNPAKALGGVFSQNLPDTIVNPDYLALKAVIDQARNKAAGPNNPGSVLGQGGAIPSSPYSQPGAPPIPTPPRPQ